VSVIRFNYYESEWSYESVQLPEDQPDASGNSSMAHLQPGRNVLGLTWSPRSDFPECKLLMKTVDLVSGPNHVTMEIPRFCELTISWRGSTFGTPVRVTVQSSENHDRCFGSDEESAACTRFEFVPVGTYDVTIRGPDREVKRHVDLQCSTKIDIVD
jgi:hypothetical protein